MLPVAIVLCALLGALAVLQIALAFGAPLGRLAWGGQDRILPPRKRVGSGVSILVYALLGAVALAKARLTDAGGDLLPVEVAMWVVTAYLALAILPNAISRSRPERFTMTPSPPSSPPSP